MPFIWKNRDLEDLSTTLRARGAGGARILSEVITDVMDEAVDMMKETIDTTPSGLVPGKPDRNYSGDMREAMNAAPVVRSATKVSGKWGWTKRKEDYFLLQDYGYSRVPPMHALLNSFVWAREELKQQIDQLVRSK